MTRLEEIRSKLEEYTTLLTYWNLALDELQRTCKHENVNTLTHSKLEHRCLDCDSVWQQEVM